MPNKLQTKMFRRVLAPAVVACAGLAITMSITETSQGIERRRERLGIRLWEDEGITGTGAVIGSLDGLPPLVAGISPSGSHRAFAKSNIVTVVFENDGIPRRTLSNVLKHAHQTATLGAMVASKTGSASNTPIGIAPDAQALVAWFAIDRDASGGFTNLDFGPSRQRFDAITYSLFGMTGQEYADVISADLGLTTPYRVASVVNSSIGIEGPAGRRGEDETSRIYDAVATMTGATLVCPTSNDGNKEDPSMQTEMPLLTDLGRVYAPGSTHNTIAVGYVGRDFNGVSSFSGAGPMQAQNYADDGLGDLYPTENMQFVNPFTPEDGGDLESTGGIFRDARPGVDIVAPGELLNLPGETFVVSGNVFNTTAHSEWTGVSFASAIVAASCGLLHELGEREGYATNNLVTKAVLLNSANKSDDGVGVGFDNMQTVDQMEDDRPEITTMGLDEESGAGSLDLTRLIRQYYLGTVVTDYMPGDGLEGLTTLGFPLQQDSLAYTTATLGTDPTIPYVTQSDNPSSPRPLSLTCQMSLGGSLDQPFDPSRYESRDPWLDGPLETQVAQVYGPFSEGVESLIDQASARIMPMAGRRDNPDLGGDRPDTGGGRPDVPGASGDDIPSGGGGAGGGQAFRSGWDSGMVGEGHIDLPIGPITPNSGISVTLVWNRHESWVLPANDFFADPDLVDFGGSGGDGSGSVAALDPDPMNEFEFEDLNLELWQVPSGPGGNRLIAASRGVWTNTECVYFPFQGGKPDGSSNGPFGNSPAEYFVRIVFNQTLWDYGGFWFCNGGMNSAPFESKSKMGFVDMPRAQVEYGLAWYVEFNTDGYPEARRAINPDTNAVDISIIGLKTNLTDRFEPLKGDVNVDFLVDVNDASLMLQNFGSANPVFDLNEDGIADALDLQMISQHIGETAEPKKITKADKKADRQRRKAYKKLVKQRRKANKKASKKLSKRRR